MVEYKNHHFGSDYGFKGAGLITDLAIGKTHRIALGVMYALNEHSCHILRPEEDWLWPAPLSRW